MLFYATKEVPGDQEMASLLQEVVKKARLAGRPDIILALDAMADVRGDRSVHAIAGAMLRITGELNNKE